MIRLKVMIQIPIKQILFIFITVLWVGQVFGYGTYGPFTDSKRRVNPNETLLSAKDAKEKLAIVNTYTGSPGCYIMCLGPEGGLYPVTNIYWLHGMIRIKGHYLVDSPTTEISKRNCYPDGLQGSFSPFTYYRDLCNTSFTTCKDLCTGSADTGSFFTNPSIKP